MPETTLLQSLVRQVDLASRAADGVARPAVVLWPDPEAQWLPLIAQLRTVMPHLYTLGSFDVEAKSGPAYWLRCIVDRATVGAPPPEVTPVFYLPEVSRQQLRSGADCPQRCQPLVELQYRGTTWHQKNGREWSVEAFLMTHLELDLAQDARTREAILRALPRLGDVDARQLQGKRLDADDFDGLAVGDAVRDLLRWMSNAKTFRAGLSEGEWKSFVSLCRSQFEFSPEDEDEKDAATRLSDGGGRWDQVWSRFAEAPRLYPGVAEALRGARHSLLGVERNPTHNASREESLRKALKDLLDEPQPSACSRIAELERDHASRRASVWAALGEASLAMALEPLARLAAAASKPAGGNSVAGAAAAYTEEGWRCDRALLDALSCPASPGDRELIAKVARNLYEPWADEGARRFQELIANTKTDDVVKDGPDSSGTCVLFVDGLRYDLGVALHEKLVERGISAQRRHRIAPLPTVTPTAKPVTVPLPGAFRAGEHATDFLPVFADSGDPVIAPKLRDALRKNGVMVLDREDLAGPERDESIGWIEVGQLDTRGHDLGVDLVKHIEDELEQIAFEVDRLTALGWRVRIVTDHGWLLLPDGLPKHQLPAYLTETKWSRCATVKRGTKTELATVSWYWDRFVGIVSPPGIHAFKAGQEYAHGGISVQECVVPEITAKRAAAAVVSRLTQIEWRGLRCRVTVSDPTPSLRVDLRTNKKNAESSLAAAAKDVMDGRADLLVADDGDEGKAAFVVLLGTDGAVIDSLSTTIGGE